MKIKIALITMLGAFLPLLAADGPKRPQILGISHVAFYVHDIEKTRAFYKDFLGFEEPYSLTNKDGALHLTWIKINDRQSIELFPEARTNAGTDRLYHVALETDDAVGMRDYLIAHGVTAPAKVGKGKIGNLNYFIQDPSGRIVEIVQYAPDGWTKLSEGKFVPDTRISTNMPHVGILADDLEPTQKFYQDILGFKEIWRGAKNPSVLNWVHERVPDGTDFLELMLYSELPPPDKRGTYHHLCLQVSDLDKAKATLESRASKINYTRPMEIKTGVNHKRQLNLYDPNGTRVELMEPKTIDGLPVASSTAPPPVAKSHTNQ
jgi:lactoylglutathione lyase